jgi:ATP-dependent RNA helicase RhlB
VLVFVNRRDQTRHLSERLQRYGINCAILSGEVPQNKRIKTLENFRKGNVRVLVATDVAARGLHVEGISHVINFTLSQDPEDYVHRIGRTGRAGASGISVSFACEEDSFYIPAIEEYLGAPLVCEQPDEALLTVPPPPPRTNSAKGKPRGGKKGSQQAGKRRSRQGSGGRKPAGEGQSPQANQKRRVFQEPDLIFYPLIIIKLMVLFLFSLDIIKDPHLNFFPEREASM